MGKSCCHLALNYPPNKLPELGVYYYGNALKKRGQKRSKSWFPSARGCGGYGRRCGQTEAATEQLIAAPAWPSCGTRPPLRNLCVLRTVRAAGSGFRGRHRALCADRGILGRLFGLRDAARPRTWRYVIAHCIRDKVHITNSWQSSRTCPVLMLLVLCMGWNFDAGRQISRDFGRETMHMMHES